MLRIEINSKKCLRCFQEGNHSRTTLSSDSTSSEKESETGDLDCPILETLYHYTLWWPIQDNLSLIIQVTSDELVDRYQKSHWKQGIQLWVDIFGLISLKTVMTCETQEDCTGPGTECIMYFCQPGNCTATGQCAYGFVCSQFGTCLRKKILSFFAD